jgi:ribonuclease BN (tRNA processing enzyme)
MKLTFLGTGSAFALNNYHSNILLEVEGRRLLIDCGSDIRFAMRDAGKTAADVDALYVSHLHADHIGGIEWLALSTYFNPALGRPALYINEKMAEELWLNSLKGGLGTLQNQIAHLETYFEVKPIGRNMGFEFAGIHMQTVQTVHYMDGYEIVPSYGLLIPTPTKGMVFLSTDTQYTPGHLMAFYQKANIIFHDCETAKNRSGIHAHYEELKSLPAAVRAKMWLYHYQDGDLPDATADGFAGFVKRGQVFEF